MSVLTSGRLRFAKKKKKKKDGRKMHSKLGSEDLITGEMRILAIFQCVLRYRTEMAARNINVQREKWS